VQLRTDLLKTIDSDLGASTASIMNEFGDSSVELTAESPPHRPEDAAEFTRAASVVLPLSAGASQILGSREEVLARYGSVAGTTSIISADVHRAVLSGKPSTFTTPLGGNGQSYRVRATAFSSNGRAVVLVVAVSLKRVEDAVRRVIALLLIAGPAALGASALAAYWLAHKAIMPVRRMTLDAQRIGADRLHERVAQPASRDEIGQLAVTLNDMLERIERGATKQRRLVADASHELRTPLAVMRVEIDVSLRGDELPPKARDVLVSAREEVDQMSRTVDNLLTLAAADEGRLELLTTRVDLRHLIEQAVRSLQTLAASKHVTVIPGGSPREVQADAQRLSLALTNLIENALHFTPPGGEVHVFGWSREGAVGVAVRDNGSGISPQDCEHVFDRFYRVDPARGRNAGGSGLGLAICREVALAHGGRIWVESEIRRGSAFFIELPSWRVVEPDRGSPTPGGSVPPPESPTTELVPNP
jgi:two-component system, OmpR family, sensor kinase